MLYKVKKYIGKYGYILLHLVTKIAVRVNPRFIISLFAAYLIIYVFCVKTILPSINKNIQSERLISKSMEFLKEIKETSRVALNVIKSLGLENVPASDIISKSTSEMSKISIIKRSDKPLSNADSRVIPLCGADIEAVVVGKNGYGYNFFESDVKFNFGSFQLPVGLEKAVGRMTSSHQYDAIVPLGQMYFIEAPQYDLTGLKASGNTGSLVSYEVKLNKISKSFHVGAFEPRIFYISHGVGDEIFCDTSVKASIKMTNLDGKTLVHEDDYVINIGHGDFPHGLEHLLMRLRVGDKISVMLNSDWMKPEKNFKHKIVLPKEKYIIFDIVIQNVKQSMNMFHASKIPTKDEMNIVQNINAEKRKVIEELAVTK